MKIAILTNEIPPIVYGGVATWILNFLDMFKNDPDIEVIPVFLAHLDEPPTDFPERYPGIRIIHGPQDIEKTFQYRKLDKHYVMEEFKGSYIKTLIKCQGF